MDDCSMCGYTVKTLVSRVCLDEDGEKFIADVCVVCADQTDLVIA